MHPLTEALNLTSQIERHFPIEIVELLRAIGEIASEQDMHLYLVGGAVRDLLLGRRNFDLDLVVEGSAIQLAKRLAKFGIQSESHPRFGTVKLQRGELIIDLVTARSEGYPKPGALPEVKPGSIKDDLFRRDFTVNAMAIQLDPANFGRLLDPYGGLEDLECGQIRILHRNSFIDDATRIFRALRYAGRLGFRLEEQTDSLLRQNIEIIQTISGDRLRHELELILEEDRPETILMLASELSALKQLLPGLKADTWLCQKFELARQQSKRVSSNMYLALLLYRLLPADLETFVQRFNIIKATRRIVRDSIKLKLKLDQLASPYIARSKIYHLLEGYVPEAIMVVSWASDKRVIKERLRLYLDELRYIKPALDGNRLKQLGVEPGKKVGECLDRLLDAKLDGEIVSEDDEVDFVRRWLAGDEKT